MFFLTESMCCDCSGVLGVTTGIPKQLVDIVALIYDVIRIGVPLILIIVGMFDMGKAVTQQKEDDIKKAQGLLVKKAIAAALVFLMFSIVSLVFNIVAGGDTKKADMWSCVNSLLNGTCTEPSKSGTGTSSTCS